MEKNTDPIQSAVQKTAVLPLPEDTGPVAGSPVASNALSDPTPDPFPNGYPSDFSGTKHRARLVWLRYAIAGLIIIAFGFVGVLALQASHAQTNVQNGDFPVSKLPLDSLNTTVNNTVIQQNAPRLIVNGQLQVSSSLLLTPSSQPAGAVAGQVYFDKTSKLLTYFNGAQFIGMGGAVSNVTNVTNVTNVAGATNVTTVEEGDTITNVFTNDNLPPSILLQPNLPTAQQNGNLGISGTAAVGILQAATINTPGSTLDINATTTTITGAVTIAGSLNVTGGYSTNGTSGATESCTAGYVLQNTVVQGGIITGGTCIGNGAGFGGVTLQGTTPGTADTGNINITGTGIFGTSVVTPSVITPLIDTATAAALNIGTTNATVINLNKDVVVAAGKSLSIVGGNTASRPASPTEGMVYYDTTTKQLLTYANGKWQGDRAAASKIVAASDSSQAAKDAADYVGDGETSSGSGTGTIDGDQIQINAALTAVGSAGGTVYLMEGTYTVDASISIPDNITLAGSGAGTLIRLGNFGSTFTSVNTITNTTTSFGTRVSIRDLRLDGQRTLNTNGDQHGIYMNAVGTGTSTSVSGAKITNVWVSNFNSNGVYLNNSSNSQITNVQTTKNGIVGIEVVNGANNIISGNTSQGNFNDGIFLSGTSYNTVSNNLSQDNSNNGITVTNGGNNTITGNLSNLNNNGIYLSQSTNNTITGNTVNANDTSGISLQVSAHYNTISGNTISANLVYGIEFNSINSSVVSGNHIYQTGGGTANNGIYLVGSDKNSFTGNEITDTACSATCYAINISNAASDTNYLSANHLTAATGTPTINDAGTGTVYSNQSLASDGGQALFRNTDSSNAFAIQNASGKSLLTADTSSGAILFGTAGASGLNGVIKFNNNTNSNTVTVQSGVTSASYALTLPTAIAATGDCLKAGTVSGGNVPLTFAACSGSNVVTLQGTTPGTPDTGNINISGTGIFGTALQSSSFDTASSGALNIGTTTATTITIGRTGQTLNTNSTAVNVQNGSLAVNGTMTTGNYKLQLLGTNNSSSTSSLYGIQNETNFNPAGASLSNIYALSNVATVTGSSLNITNLSGISTSIATSSGYTGLITDARGFSIGGPTIGGSQKFTEYTGINVGGNSANGGNTSGTITNKQINVGGTTIGAGTGGTVNNYGISLTQPSGTGGTTNNYGLYIQGAGAGTANWSIYNASSAASYYAGTVLIGTTSNTGGYALNIQGSAAASTSLLTPLIDTATAVALNIGTTNATVINLNKDVTVAAGKSLAIAGGVTGTRPASPTEGMVYYDTTTKQLLTYANGKWQGDRATASKIVAASDSPQSAKDAADYVGDGENSTGSGTGTIDGDQIQINAALTALGAGGGTVYLMEGTYTVDASISLPNNVTLSGSGASTLVRLGNFGGTATNVDAIKNTNTSTGARITVRDLRMDGRSSINTNGAFYGISVAGMGAGSGSTAVPGATISNVEIANFRTVGINLATSTNSSVLNSKIIGINDYSGIYLDTSPRNIIKGNSVQGSYRGIGVNASDGAIVSGNILTGNSQNGLEVFSSTGVSLESNNFYNNVNGIYISSVVSSTVTGNTINNTTQNGIKIESSSYNTVSSNSIVGTNGTGITIDQSSYNQITGNNVYSTGGSTTFGGIYALASDYNSITSNYLTDILCTSNCYGIDISGSTNDNNYLSSNMIIVTGGTGSINDTGTGTVYANQSLAANGSQILFRNANTTTALQIQNASGTSLFIADTTNMKISISGTDTTFARLVLDNAHFGVTQTNAPLVGIPVNCGTTPTASVTASSADSAGSFTITTGTGGTSSTCETLITFRRSYAAAPKSIIVVAKGSAAAAARQVYVSTTLPGAFGVSFGVSAGGANSTAYSFSYWVVE